MPWSLHSLQSARFGFSGQMGFQETLSLKLYRYVLFKSLSLSLAED